MDIALFYMAPQVWDVAYSNTNTLWYTFCHSGLDGFGWTRKNGYLEILWEDEKHKTQAKERIDYILNGCRCKTGCKSNRCKCRKGGRVCGPGCQCLNCVNTHLHGEGSWDEEVHEMEVQGQEDVEEEETYETDEEETYERTEYEDEEMQSIMAMVFGEDEEDEEAEACTEY